MVCEVLALVLVPVLDQMVGGVWRPALIRKQAVLTLVPASHQHRFQAAVSELPVVAHMVATLPLLLPLRVGAMAAMTIIIATMMMAWVT